MKSILTAVILCVANILAAQDNRFTADYYLADPASYEGTYITIYIANASPARSETVPTGYISYGCWTRYNNTWGGCITALVAEDLSPSFARKYAGKMFSGVGKAVRAYFCKRGGEYVLIIGGDIEKLRAAKIIK